MKTKNQILLDSLKKRAITTHIGRDFSNACNYPSIDRFLDYRSSVMEMKESSNIPIDILDAELNAIDEIITILTEMNDTN